MNNLLVCTVFVISLWSTGLGLACVQCTNPTASSCHGELRNCSGDDLCVSTVTETTAANGQKTFTFDRACGDAAQCNVTGSMTSFISAITHTTCCDTDSCTPRPPTLSKEKGEENAIRCPACLAHSRAQCSSLKVSKNCTGDEKFCAVYEVKSDTERTIIMGCASESFCRTANSQKLIEGKITKMVARCVRNQSNGLMAPPLHLLPALLGPVVHLLFIVRWW